MAIQIASQGNSGAQVAAASFSVALPWSGSDRLLAIDISLLGVGVSIVSMTYGGAACTLIGGQASLNSLGRIEQWRINQSDSGAPGSGSNVLSVTLSGSVEFLVSWTAFTGVLQTTPIEGFASARATNSGVATDASLSITSITDNCWIHAACVSDDLSISAGQVSSNNVVGVLGSMGSEDGGILSTAGSMPLNYSGIGILASWVMTGFAIRPSLLPVIQFADQMYLGRRNRRG